jgi:hypothetical protein
MLMACFTATALVMGLLLFIRIPQLERFFLPTLPPSPTASATPVAGSVEPIGSPTDRKRVNGTPGSRSMNS